MSASLPDQQARLNARAVFLVDTVTGLPTQGGGATGIPITGTAAAAAGVTVTIPAAAGKFNYLQSLSIAMYAASALTGGATPVVVTTTGMPNNPAFTFPTALPIGQEVEQNPYQGGTPIKGSTVNTAITIVCPATTGVIWRVNAVYFQA